MKKETSKWIIDDDGEIRCDNCGSQLPYVIGRWATFEGEYPHYTYIDKTPFCPYCGIKMDIEN